MYTYAASLKYVNIYKNRNQKKAKTNYNNKLWQEYGLYLRDLPELKQLRIQGCGGKEQWSNRNAGTFILYAHF